MSLQRDSAPNTVALIDEKDKALLVGQKLSAWNLKCIALGHCKRRKRAARAGRSGEDEIDTKSDDDRRNQFEMDDDSDLKDSGNETNMMGVVELCI